MRFMRSGLAFCGVVLFSAAAILTCQEADGAGKPRRGIPDAAATRTFRKPFKEPVMIEDGYLWIEAEDFKDYGGWMLDTQFVYLMGSAYLIANGIGQPVADAVTPVAVSRTGRYRVWVRARNWIPGHSPGRFEVWINGKALPHVFGAAGSDEWLWESGGEVELAKGEAVLALHDLTGYFGRCDAIVLTSDMDYAPPADREGVVKERARLTGLSLKPEPAGEFDVIVVGAGPAGCPAALAAARLGARTALIQNRPVLGGNASHECGVPMNGASVGHVNARETGISEETGRVKAHLGLRYYGDAFAELIREQQDLTVFLNRHVFDTAMNDGKRIAAVRAVDTLTGEISEYRAKLFIDTTGDGWVGYYAKAEYRLGREARNEHNESLAPEKADDITMSGCLMGDPPEGFALGFRAVDTGKPTRYVPPSWAHKMPDHFGRAVPWVHMGSWWLEHPGSVDDVWEAEKARDELIRITFGYWDFVKNRSEMKEEARNYALSVVPIMNARRESRRLIGDYILTENDVLEGRMFPDRISYGGWPIDLHHPEGIFSGKQGPWVSNKSVPKLYSIPYRCLYSNNIENLLFAGRCASVTHVALGTVRVESTLATLGQAAGTAAAMCVRKDCTPRDIYEKHISELQQTLLKHDQTIPSIVNEDPADLARGAAIRASSTAVSVEAGDVAPDRNASVPLNVERGVLVPVHGPQPVAAAVVHLVSNRKEPVPITLHAVSVTGVNDLTPVGEVAKADATLPPSGNGVVRFSLRAELSGPFAVFWLPRTSGVMWRVMGETPPGARRLWRSKPTDAWRVERHKILALATEPRLRYTGDFSPAHVINGKARIVGDDWNMWASDPAQPLPQWIELDFGKPVELNAVHLTFDTELGQRNHNSGDAQQCARDYELSAWDGTAWTLLWKEEGNFQRHRIHAFKTVTTDKLRVTVLATNGDKSARIFEIRAYREPGP